MTPLEANDELPEEVQTMIQQSNDALAAEALVRYVIGLAAAAEIRFTDVQLQVLTNHLIEMLNRSQSGEQLPAVDPQMFADVSQKSLDLADQVVRHIGHLAVAEKYILSIHFEAAQNKI
ncbi:MULTISPECIES: transcriptional regulator [Lacticaseibacillus]|uniref:Transcriptional regulator n=2 Tax=Lacticaseibacillus TaxID=2759736 RepID=A0AAN1F0V5_LACCA|nr:MULTISPECIES: transcriptional regulator [Lacticaseibacillus]ARY92715.1 transcriptional regulator [Lacticaseibacillus casei]KAB1969442.1 transcriptional regulator [Lacticaseibacillus casei]WLV80617.1 transcriptional regulator [Lacticaseibacillus sp. NCIMB 15473]WNX24577.1 transcriptional regulator [Lacticaseibacillus casei]WNX27349.1 transcriptional regulator [Lacticaseibacillus casei]